MRSLWDDQTSSIRTDVAQINSYAEKPAALNYTPARQADAATNDLKDELNLLLDELSGYVNIEYRFNETDGRHHHRGQRACLRAEFPHGHHVARRKRAGD